MIAITGATGKTGSRVAAALLEAKQPVRVLARSAEKVAGLREQGAEVAIGTLTDPAFLKTAFDGCSGAYLVTPLNWSASDPAAEEIAIGRAMAEALAGSTVHVVYLSVLKARDKTGIPHFESKAEIETALEAACPTLTVLRPAFFMENLLAQIGALRSTRTISLPMPSHQPLAMVSTADIAEVAKQAFVRGPKGKEIYDVIGMRCYTPGECARLIGNSLGRTVYYKEMSDQDFTKMLKATGASDKSVADLLCMFRYFKESRFTGDFDNVRRAFKYTSVTFEKFAEFMVSESGVKSSKFKVQ